MLNRNDKNWWFCLVLGLNGNVSSLSPLNIVLTMDMFVYAIYDVEEVPSYFGFVEHFCFEKVLNFIRFFFYVYWDDHVLFFILLIIMSYSNWFSDVKQLGISGIKPTWSWCVILFMCCWVQFESASCSVVSDSLWLYGIHGILQAGILEWVVFPFSRGSFQPRDRTQVSRIAGGFFTNWAIREAS